MVSCSNRTFCVTVNPVLYESGKPVFIDSESKTWNMNPKALEKAFELYPEVKLVVLVHLYGTPAQAEEILRICGNIMPCLLRMLQKPWGFSTRIDLQGALETMA